jgi:lipopolysaccharide transport system permease protein
MEYEIKPSEKFSLGLRELWQYRELFYFFTWRDIKVKYKQTFFGFAWAIFQPLLMMLLFSFFFGTKLKVPSEGIPYPLFVFSGLLLWNIFSSGLSNASNSMVTNSNIIKKIYFPRLIIPLSSVLGALFDFLMALLIFIPILLWYGSSLNILVLIPSLLLSILIVTITTFGAGSWLAALNVKYRDFRYVIPFTIQVLMFVTPVIYPTSIIDNDSIRFILDLNPMSGAITLFRNAVAGEAIPWTPVITGLSTSILILFMGVYYFKKTEAYFADIS